MILYKLWGKHLRLGNWLFLYSGLLSLIKNSNNKLCLPDYFLWDYLENKPEIDNGIDNYFNFTFRQTSYSVYEKKYLIDYFKENENNIININVSSNLQSENWFIENLDYVKNYLKIKESKINEVKTKYKNYLDKPTIGIGIRRGDFVNHSCFYQIPEYWYLKVLKEEFPNHHNYNVIIFSDDIDWCKDYYKNENFLFAEPNNTHTHSDNFKHYHNNPMEQFILGTLCDNFIGGNSTFSWWQMWYVKNFNNGKVFHCGENLAGNCIQTYNNPDFYPKNWIFKKIN